MKLSSANVIRTFLFYIWQECANHPDCKGCVFFDEYCMLREKPRKWWREEILERYDNIGKYDKGEVKRNADN